MASMRAMAALTPSSARVGVYSRERTSPWGVIRAVTILVPPRSTARTVLPVGDSAMTEGIIAPKGRGGNQAVGITG